MFLKIKEKDEIYTVPFPTNIPDPSLVVIGTPESGQSLSPLCINCKRPSKKFSAEVGGDTDDTEQAIPSTEQ